MTASRPELSVEPIDSLVKVTIKKKDFFIYGERQLSGNCQRNVIVEACTL